MKTYIIKEDLLERIDEMIRYTDPDKQGNHPIALEVMRAVISNMDGVKKLPNSRKKVSDNAQEE